MLKLIIFTLVLFCSLFVFSQSDYVKSVQASNEYKSLAINEKEFLQKSFERYEKTKQVERKEKMKKRIQKFLSATPEERKKIMERVNKFKSLSPEMRAKIKKFRKLPPQERQMRLKKLHDQKQ